MIQIPVLASYEDPEAGEVRVRAFTLSVNAHGCLLAMDVKPAAGQRMRLVNARSTVERTGRVIRAERARDGSFAVSFEFDTPAPDLWSFGTPSGDRFA